jgi:hypothetical protein
MRWGTRIIKRNFWRNTIFDTNIPAFRFDKDQNIQE